MWNMFRTCGRDDQQGAVASAWIIKNMKGKKIAIVHDKTTYGQGLADETKKGLNKGGMKEVLYEGVNLGEKDFSALVSKIKASGADLVYWGGLHTEGGLIVRQMRDQGVKAPLMGGDGITSDEFATDRRPRRRGHADDLRARSAQASGGQGDRGEIPRQEVRAGSLHALQLRRGRSHQAGGRSRPSRSTRRRSPRQIKSGKKFKTVIGELAYDKKGDITRPDYVMYVWKKDASGKITYVELGQQGLLISS